MFVKGICVTFFTPFYPQEHMFCGNRPEKPWCDCSYPLQCWGKPCGCRILVTRR